MNGFASLRDDIVFIVCSSATSWMLNKIIHNKGGLYNRITEKIHLDSFSLLECENLLKSKNIVIPRIQILEYYMVFGGVPYYWNFINKGLSISQNIDNILFAKDAQLKDEFNYLYASIFKNPCVYIKLIETLSKKKAGMRRDEIIESSGIINSGDLSIKLEELESCGFIRSYFSYGNKKKNKIYQLIDNFTLFYYMFMEKGQTDEHFWTNQINTPAVNTWMGLAFERVSLEHITQIKKKLGISGVLTNVYSWYAKEDTEKGIRGTQIDLLIERMDRVINICEMKYSNNYYSITKSTYENINRKIDNFIKVTQTKYSIQPILVTTYGLDDNMYSSIICCSVTLDDLFEEI